MSKLIIGVIAFSIGGLWAQPTYGLKPPSATFDIPQNLAQRVNFWTQVFLHFDDDTIIIHDRDQPWLIVDILSFSELAQTRKQPKYLQRNIQAQFLAQYNLRLSTALRRLAQHRKNALKYGALERRIYTAYQETHQNLNRLFNGRVKIRAQRGLADSFIKGARAAQDYLPYFEKEFREVGIPEELTRLAFVESMFNPYAISKVGASGMWQFMKTTAIHFMQVNHRIDERRSPFKSARAAASLLKEDYEALGKWPLAITAYNHGRGGVRRAIKHTHSDEIHAIIANYRSPSFRFASANFYTEFLAAVHSYYHLVNTQAINTTPSRLFIKDIKLKHPTKIKDLPNILGVNQAQLEQLNRCIKPQTFKQYAGYLLPASYRLYVPQSITYNPPNSTL